MSEPSEPSEPKYTHGHHESVLRAHRTRTAQNSAAYLLGSLAPGLRLLDVGCGPGTITADLASIVAPGRVTAIEPVPEALELARACAVERDQHNIDFVVADVHALQFGDNSFDVVHAHQVLQHVADPVTALAEMRRVCKPGGVVAARDSDYAAFAWHPASTQLDDWLRLYRDAARANGGEPDAGRRLLAWAHAAGFTDVTPSVSATCYATPAEREHWGGMWADRILHSAIAEQLLSRGVADQAKLQAISRAWRDWAGHPDGWLAIPHSQILCRG
ncbi:class I SAM-dependent methyltransferase [Mycolicibacter senuensis]|uniref:class I SAM-dependent methyltransferase n=1 Tax=Mycolicibacter senuensis TaxID=386913 RepID=UPI000A16A613|nr:methyltransferase domain-containing protein [Mycolicibacter senuensis]